MHLLIRYRVADFIRWREVFESHRKKQREAGLHLEHLWRNIDDTDEVVLLFKVDDYESAREYVYSDDIPEALNASGVLDQPDIYFLE